jgi:hypothetical protein
VSRCHASLVNAVGADRPGAIVSRGGTIGIFARPGRNDSRPVQGSTERTDRRETGRPPTQYGAPARHALEVAEPDYVLWIHLGAESVFFYPPGSVEEHLVVEHGIPSVDMHWKVQGYYDHEGDHRKQRGVRSGMVGDLVAVTHAHAQAA